MSADIRTAERGPQVEITTGARLRTIVTAHHRKQDKQVGSGKASPEVRDPKAIRAAAQPNTNAGEREEELATLEIGPHEIRVTEIQFRADLYPDSNESASDLTQSSTQGFAHSSKVDSGLIHTNYVQ